MQSTQPKNRETSTEATEVFNQYELPPIPPADGALKNVGGNTIVSSGNLQSPNYSNNGSSGFIMQPNGDAIFNNLTARGRLTVTAGGVVGGFDIGLDYLRDTGNSFGLSSTVTGGDDIRFWAGSTLANFATAPFRLTEAGVLTAESGTIGGWIITAAVLQSGASGGSSNVLLDPTNSLLRLGPTTGNYITLDGANLRIRSSNYQTGTSGFTVEPTLIEAENIIARGTLRGTTFAYDVVSAIGGQLMVANADTLASDMTALDASTLTTKGDTTFAVNDILLMRGIATSGIQEEWMRVTNIASAPTYTVTRDIKGDFTANNNPVWKAGTPVVKQGKSDGASTYSGGWLRLIGEGTNAPYYSVFSRTGVAYNSYTEAIRLGNLNGFLDYSSDLYGIGIGTSAQYLKYDPTNGLRISGNVINITYTTSGETISGATAPAAVFINRDQTPTNDWKFLSYDTNGTNDTIYTTNRSAQTFTVDANINSISKVSVELFKDPSHTFTTEIVTCGIYATSAGLPTGAALGTATMLANSIFPTSNLNVFFDFVFSSPISVTAGAVYAIVIYTNAAGSPNYIYWVRTSDSSNPYTGGQAATSTNSGSTWAAVANQDYSFKVYGTYSNGLTTDYLYLSDSNTVGRNHYNGFAITTATVGNSITLQTTGIVSGFSGLKSGTTYYLNNNTYDFSVINEDGGVNQALGSGTTIAKVAQTFKTPSYRSKIYNLKLQLKKQGSPSDNIVVKIYDQSMQTLLTTSTTTLAGSSLTTSYTTQTFSFSYSGSFSASTTYAIVIERSGSTDGSNYYFVNSAASSYADGFGYEYNSSTTTWVQTSNDAWFDIYFNDYYKNNNISILPGTYRIPVGKAISATELMITYSNQIVSGEYSGSPTSGDIHFCNCGFKPSRIKIIAGTSNTSSERGQSVGEYKLDSYTGYYIYANVLVGVLSTNIIECGINGARNYLAPVQLIDNGFLLEITFSGSGSNALNYYWEAEE